MGFADFYFEKHLKPVPLIETRTPENVSIIITIPCFNEPGIIKALEGLYFCTPTKGTVEVIVMLNYPEAYELEFGKTHSNQYFELINWAKDHNRDNLQFYILLRALPQKEAGVGLARKIAMDEALYRFNTINMPRGIIAGFDADCGCSANYLIELENTFNSQKINGCSVYFEHPLEGTEHKPEIFSAITYYELYLRYYVEALRFVGFPYAYHTLGSSFAVTALTYAKQGGMNKRKAGEDFYFLHKIIPQGGYVELNNCSVYPSPRCSDRVPFGTGAAVNKIIEYADFDYNVFNPIAFIELQKFFQHVQHFKNVNEEKIKIIITNLHPSIQVFLEMHEFTKALHVINNNCKNAKAFHNAFFNWFNGLMVLKYLNFSHENHFVKLKISNAAKQMTGIEAESPKELLVMLRRKQREQQWWYGTNYQQQ